MEGLDIELTNYFKNKKIIKINNIYSKENKQFYVFYIEEKEEEKKKMLSNLICLIITLNPLKLEEVDLKIKIDSLSDDSFVLNPFNDNELCIISKREYFIFELDKINNQQYKYQLYGMIKKIKFSYFPNYIGVLYTDNSFKYINLEKNEDICTKQNKIENIVDFDFCPIILKGFEIFIVFFLFENGNININGPIFPQEFKIEKNDIFIIENNLLQKIKNDKSLMFSYRILQELKKCLSKEKSDEDNFYFISNTLIRTFNENISSSNLLIQENFINIPTPKTDKKYKQIYILKNKPLTILRIENTNKIDIILINDDIFYSNKQMDFNNIGNKLFNNYLIEKIDLGLDIMNSNLPLTIIPFKNNEFLLKINNNIFSLYIPYLVTINQLYEYHSYGDNIKINNYQSIVKKIVNAQNFINICCILLTNKEICIIKFGDTIISKIVKIENNKEENQNYLDSLFLKNEKENREIEKIQESLNLKNFINSSFLKELSIELNKDEEKDDSFEDNLLNQINMLWMYYISIYGKNYETFINKCEIMNKIYTQIDISNINERYKYLNSLITKIENCKNEFEENNKIINKKIEKIKEKLGIIQGNNKLILCYLQVIENFEKKYMEIFHNTELAFINSLEQMKEISKYSSSKLLPKDKIFKSDFLTNDTKANYEKFKNFISEFKANINKLINFKEK